MAASGGDSESGSDVAAQTLEKSGSVKEVAETRKLGRHRLLDGGAAGGRWLSCAVEVVRARQKVLSTTRRRLTGRPSE